MDNIKDLPGIKKQDIKKCFNCDNGVMHKGDPQFYKISLESYLIDPSAVQRHSGMENMMGGGSFGATMACVMGPNEDIAKQMFEVKDKFLCSDCVLRGGFRVTSLICEDEDDIEDVK